MPHENRPPVLRQIVDGYFLEYSTIDEKTGESLGHTALKGATLEALIVKLAMAHRSALQLNARTKRAFLQAPVKQSETKSL